MGPKGALLPYCLSNGHIARAAGQHSIIASMMKKQMKAPSDAFYMAISN